MLPALKVGKGVKEKVKKQKAKLLSGKQSAAKSSHKPWVGNFLVRCMDRDGGREDAI